MVKWRRQHAGVALLFAGSLMMALLVAHQPQSDSAVDDAAVEQEYDEPITGTPAVLGKPVDLAVQWGVPAITMADCVSGICPHANIEHIESNNPWLNQFIDAQILGHYHLTDANGRSYTPANFQALADSLNNGVDAQGKPLFKHALSVNVDYLGVMGQLGLFLITWRQFGDQPGSAEVQQARFYVLDVSRQRELKLGEVLQKGQRDKLEKLLQQAMPPALQQAQDSRQLLNNFMLAKEGLRFTYPEYHPRHSGDQAPVYTIPYQQLKGIIRREYLGA